MGLCCLILILHLFLLSHFKSSFVGDDILVESCDSYNISTEEDGM